MTKSPEYTSRILRETGVSKSNRDTMIDNLRSRVIDLEEQLQRMYRAKVLLEEKLAVAHREIQSLCDGQQVRARPGSIWRH